MYAETREILGALCQISLLLMICQTVPAQQKNIAEEQESGLVVNVIVEGLNDEQKKNALIYLELEKNKENPDLNELWLKRLHSRAPENIKRSLRPFGYYQVTVESYLDKDSAGIWQAQYLIKPGQRVKFKKVDVQISGGGANDDEILAALKKVHYVVLTGFQLMIREPIKLVLLQNLKQKKQIVRIEIH